MPTATLITAQIEGWAPGTRHYRTSDGQDLAVECEAPPDFDGDVIEVQPGEAPLVGELLRVLGETEQAVKIVVRPTVIFTCTPEGAAIDLTPLHTFDPGTSHEDALEMSGYTVT